MANEYKGKGRGQYNKGKALPTTPVKPDRHGHNADYIKVAMAAWDKPKVDTKDPQAIDDRITEYLHFCMEQDVSPSVLGCTTWLGTNRDLLQDYYTGTRGTPEHQRVAQKFYNVMQSLWAMDMRDGNINPVAGIFMGKVFYGYKDSQEIVINNNVNSQDRLTREQLIAESKRLPGAENLALPDGTQTVQNNMVDIDAKVVEVSETPKKKRGRPKKS